MHVWEMMSLLLCAGRQIQVVFCLPGQHMCLHYAALALLNFLFDVEAVKIAVWFLVFVIAIDFKKREASMEHQPSRESNVQQQCVSMILQGLTRRFPPQAVSNPQVCPCSVVCILLKHCFWGSSILIPGRALPCMHDCPLHQGRKSAPFCCCWVPEMFQYSGWLFSQDPLASWHSKPSFGLFVYSLLGRIDCYLFKPFSRLSTPYRAPYFLFVHCVSRIDIQVILNNFQWNSLCACVILVFCVCIWSSFLTLLSGGPGD